MLPLEIARAGVMDGVAAEERRGDGEELLRQRPQGTHPLT